MLFIANTGDASSYCELVILREHQRQGGRPSVGLQLSASVFGNFPESAWKILNTLGPDHRLRALDNPPSFRALRKRAKKLMFEISWQCQPGRGGPGSVAWDEGDAALDRRCVVFNLQPTHR